MLDDKTSKEELLQVISNLEVKLMDFEETKKDLTESEHFLSQAALELVELPSDTDIYEFTAMKLKKIFPDAMILVSYYNEHSNRFGVGALHGINKTWFSRLKKILGNKVSMESKVSYDELSQSDQKGLLAREFVKTTSYLAFAGLFPEKALMITDKLLGIIETYVIGLVWKKKLYGTVIVFMRSKGALNKKETVETLVNMVSVAMQRREAEAKLKESENKYRAIFENTGTATII